MEFNYLKPCIEILSKMNDDPRIADWINNTLSEFSRLNDVTGVEILHKCGAACCTSSRLYQGACSMKSKNVPNTDIDTLFNAFRNEYRTSGNVTKEGNTITLLFDECTCPMVKNGVTDSFLCNCTVGYSRKLFETLFDRQVTIDLEKSILRGDPVCRQVIRISD